MAWTEEQSNILSTLSITLSTISLICCFIIIFSWFKFKELRKLGYSIIFYMAIPTGIRQFVKMWGGGLKTGHFMCTLQAYLLTGCGLSTFYWIFCTSLVMYLIIFYPFIWKHKCTNPTKILLLVNYIIPMVIALIPVFHNEYANVGGWCWILGETTTQKVYRWMCFYGQLVIVFIFCLYTYIRIYIFLYHTEKGKSFATRLSKLFHRIKWYPLCLILGYGVSTFKRFYELFDELPYIWSVLQSITTGLFGFFLLMVYGNIGKLNKLFCPACYKHMKGKRNQDDETTNNNESNIDVTANGDTVPTQTGTASVNEMQIIRATEHIELNNHSSKIETKDDSGAV